MNSKVQHERQIKQTDKLIDVLNSRPLSKCDSVSPNRLPALAQRAGRA